MLLDEAQVAVTELIMRCRAAASRYQDAAEIAPDQRLLVRLESLAAARREHADALERLLRDTGVMPHDSEAEAETLRSFMTYLRANFTEGPGDVVARLIQQSESSLQEAIDAARTQSLSPAVDRRIDELEQAVTAARHEAADDSL